VQIIPVDRVSAESRHHAAGNIRRRAIDNKWPNVMLFPEGTTTNGRAIISFKTGAFSPGLPVQPLVIRYPHKYVNPCWCDQGGPLVILFQLMTQVVNFMEVTRHLQSMFCFSAVNSLFGYVVESCGVLVGGVSAGHDANCEGDEASS
jgi:hypothetical protein